MASQESPCALENHSSSLASTKAYSKMGIVGRNLTSATKACFQTFRVLEVADPRNFMDSNSCQTEEASTNRARSVGASC